MRTVIKYTLGFQSSDMTVLRLGFEVSNTVVPKADKDFASPVRLPLVDFSCAISAMSKEKVSTFGRVTTISREVFPSIMRRDLHFDRSQGGIPGWQRSDHPVAMTLIGRYFEGMEEWE